MRAVISITYLATLFACATFSPQAGVYAAPFNEALEKRLPRPFVYLDHPGSDLGPYTVCPLSSISPYFSKKFSALRYYKGSQGKRDH